MIFAIIIITNNIQQFLSHVPTNKQYNSSLCQSCSIPLPNCTLCSDNATCTSCLNTSFNLFTTGCFICSNLFTDCYNCTLTACFQCYNDTYALHNTSCNLCSVDIPNCIHCSNSSNCTVCMNSTYVLSGGNCPLCNVVFPNCSVCLNQSCTNCISNIFFLNSTGCNICNASYPFCHSCSGPLNCLTCQFNYFNIISNLSCQTCTNQISYCLVCLTISTCQTCINSSYFVNSSNLCVACDSVLVYCNQCLNQSYCIGCSSPNYTFFTVSVGNNICEPCYNFIPHCSTCSSIYTCTICMPDYFNNTFQGFQSCISCDIMVIDCITCPNAGVCTICRSNIYYLNNISQCILCSTALLYCQQCTNQFKCNKCVTSNYYVNQTSGTCLLCENIFPRCIYCDIAIKSCTLCKPYFIPNWLGQCVCQFGSLVSGICTTIIGCISAIQAANGTVFCQACDPFMFISTPINNMCECSNGSLVGQVCNNIIGCMTPIINHGQIICAFCDWKNQFKNDPSGNCTCQNNYKLIGTVCVEICGDGFVMNSSMCDDGNNINGDGCSSTCQPEIYYKCYNGTTTSKSFCVYKGIPLKIKIKKIYKTHEENQGIFQFTIYPPIMNVGKMNLSKEVTFVCNSMYKVKSITYQSGLLKLAVDYTQDLQNLDAQLILNFDQRIVSPNITFPFNIKSINFPLIITKNLFQIQNFKTIYRVLSYIVFGLFLVSLSHKMIGVQLLTTCQMVYFSNSFYYKNNLFFSTISEFKMVNGYKQLFYQKTQEDILDNFSRSLEINFQFLGNTAFINSVQILILIIWVGIILKKSLIGISIQENKDKSPYNHDYLKNYLLKLKKYYYILVYPLIIGFFYEVTLSAHINNLRLITDSHFFYYILNNVVEFVILGFMGTVAGVQILNIFSKKCPLPTMGGLDGCNRFYIPIFLLKICSLIIMIESGIHETFNQVVYVIACFQFVYLVVIIILRPYLKTFHNFTIIYNQILALTSVCLAISSYFIYIDQLDQIMIIFLLQGMIMLAILFALIRVILVYIKIFKAICKKSKNQSHLNLLQKSKSQEQQLQNKLQQHQINNLFYENNPYRLKNQTTMEKHLTGNEQKRKKYVEHTHIPIIEPSNYQQFVEDKMKRRIKMTAERQEDCQEIKQIKKKLKNNLDSHRKLKQLTYI